LAALRGPSRISPGPPGSWPLRFDKLVQPVWDEMCVSCHKSGSGNEKAGRFDLTATNSYENLLLFAEKDLEKLAFERDKSVVGECPARRSKLLAILTQKEGHEGVRIDPDSFNRLVTWMDVYAQRQGSFSERQEQNLRDFRREMAAMLGE